MSSHPSATCWRDKFIFCYRCLKLKVDKAKMLAISGVKKAIFDRLCNQMEKISQQLSSMFLTLSL